MRVQGKLLSVLLAAFTMLVSCILDQDIRVADNLVDRGRYTEALEVYRRLLTTDPDNEKILQRLVTTKQLESRRLVAMADTRLAHDDFETAFELYSDAVRYDPNNTEAAQGLETARDRWADEADRLFLQRRFEDALAIHKRILREFRDVPRSLDAVRRIHVAQAEDHRKRAQDYLERGLPGNALIAYLKAQSLVPDAPELQQEIAQAARRLEENTTFTVQIDHKRGSRFKANLWALYLNGVFEKAAQPIVLVAGPSTHSYHVLLSGSVSRVRTSARRIQASVRVQDGVTRVPNPAYAALAAKVDDAERKVQRLEPQVLELQNQVERLVRDRERTGSGTATLEEESLRRRLAEVRKPYREAVDQFRRLSSQLARIPQYFEKPVYRAETYPAREIRRWVRVTGRVTITAPDGTQVDAFSLNDLIEVRQVTHPAIEASGTRPSMPEAKADLPAPGELYLRAESAAMARLQEALENLYADHVENLWQQARRLAFDGKTDAATETFLEAYLSDPDHPVDEVVRYILEAKQAIALPLEDFLVSLVQGTTASHDTPAAMAE